MFDVLALALIQFVSPGGGRVDVNPEEISSVREPHGTLLASGVKCVIGLANGRFISLGENCAAVRFKLQGRESETPCVTVCGAEKPR